MEIDEQNPASAEDSPESEQVSPEAKDGPDLSGSAPEAAMPEFIEEPRIPFTSAGLLLANAREQLGLSTYEVSVRLHLTEHYVRALETGEYDKLPGEVYVKGYLKSYALLLGIEAEQVLAAYQQSGAPAAVVNTPIRSEPAKSSRHWIGYVLLAVVAGIVAGAGWWAYQAFGPAAGTVVAAAARHKHGKTR